jgi:5-hydroxyisourate hydrolase-like protein (transthyretin family)
MRLRTGILYFLVILLAAATLWVMFRGGEDVPGPAPSRPAGTAPPPPPPPPARVDGPAEWGAYGDVPLGTAFRRDRYTDPTKGGISGHVQDAQGRAASGVMVEIIEARVIGQPTQFFTTTKMLTDRNGYYAFLDLAPDRYYFMCGAEREVLPVGAGELLVRDITLPGGNRVSGEVVDAAGRRIFPAFVYLISGQLRLVTRTLETGRFQVAGVPAGSYQIFARADGFTPSARKDVELAEGEDAPGITLLVEAGCVVSGVVRDGTSRPLEKIRVSTQPDPARLGTVSGETDAQGFFELEGVPAGRVTLQVWAEGTYTRTGPTLEVAPDRPNTVEIVIGGSARLVVRVTASDGADLPEDLQVTLRPKDAPRGRNPDRLQLRGQPDATGRCEMSRLEAGTYVIQLETGDRRFLPVPERMVDVREGASQEVAITLDRGARINGLVQDTDGAPAQNFRVSLSLRETAGKVQRRTAQSDADGRFTFDLLPAGTATLEIMANGFLPVKRENLGVPSGGEVPVTLVLDRGTQLEGLVADDAGVPRPNVNVIARPYGDSSFRMVAQAVTGPDGRYALSGLRPGTYIVYAVYRGGGVNTESQSQSITVERAGARLSLDFTLRPTTRPPAPR